MAGIRLRLCDVVSPAECGLEADTLRADCVSCLGRGRSEVTIH